MSLRSLIISSFVWRVKEIFPVNGRTSSVCRVSVSFSSKIHFEKVGAKVFVGVSAGGVMEDCVKKFAKTNKK